MSDSQVPKVKGLFLLGNIFDFLKDPFAYIEMVAAHGDVVQVNLAGTTVHYVFHPSDVERILLKNANNYVKGSLMKRSKIVFGDGLILSEGDDWKQQRKRMAHSFSHAYVAKLADPIAKMAHTHLSDMEGERQIDEDFMEITLEVVMRLLFGNTVGDDLKRLGDAFQTVSIHFSKILYQIPVPLWIPIPRNIRYNHAMKTMQAVIRRIIDDRLAESHLEHDDILAKLMDNSIKLPALNETLLQDELRTLMLAGHETTSLALTYSTWFLSGDLEFQDELYRELAAVVGDEPVQGKHLKHLTMISDTVREAIRLLPPAPIFGRQAIENDTLGGYEIPAGSTLILCPFRTHNDPRWFNDPKCFNPKRWTQTFKEELPRFAYYPFGGGSRICIGMHLAMMEATLILAELIRQYRLERTTKSTLELLPAITLSIKSPLTLKLSKRQSF